MMTLNEEVQLRQRVAALEKELEEAINDKVCPDCGEYGSLILPSPKADEPAPSGAGKGGVMSHHCHATACRVAVPPEMFMCRRHWFSLPKPMRDRIWRTYRAGQCDDMNPSDSYCEAAKACVIHIAEKEGRTPDTALYDLFLGQEPSGESETPDIIHGGNCDHCGEPYYLNAASRSYEYSCDCTSGELCSCGHPVREHSNCNGACQHCKCERYQGR